MASEEEDEEEQEKKIRIGILDFALDISQVNEDGTRHLIAKLFNLEQIPEYSHTSEIPKMVSRNLDRRKNAIYLSGLREEPTRDVNGLKNPLEIGLESRRMT